MNILSSFKARKFVGVVFLLSVILIILSPTSAFATNGDGFFKDFNVEIGAGGDLSYTEPTAGSGFAGILEKYKGFIVGVGGIAAVTMVAIFIFHLISLGKSAGNPQARTQALTGLMWTGVATAGLGAVALITALFYGSLKD